MMVQMTMACEGRPDEGRDRRLSSVLDPCVGTGRMLLAASNYSVNLSGCDIDEKMVNACAINMALFAPWAVYQSSWQKRLLKNEKVDEVGRVDEAVTAAKVQSMVETREFQGHPAVENPGTFDRHGQGLLFSFPEG